MTNEQRAEKLIQQLGFDFSAIPKGEIRRLLEEETAHFQSGSAEYIRLLCGYLFCLGDSTDAPLLEKAKHTINFDVGCMIDQAWIDSLKNVGAANPEVPSREALVQAFVSYYTDFTAEEDVSCGSMFSSPLFDG